VPDEEVRVIRRGEHKGTTTECVHESLVINPYCVACSFKDQGMFRRISHRPVVEKGKRLQEQLRIYSISQDASMKMTGGMLRMLNKEFSNICLDPRTLRKTPRTTDVKSIDGGSYVHFGLIRNIILLLIDPRYKDTVLLGLQLNFDGVEITKGNMWPIQARIVSPFLSSPFLVGTFYSTKKLRNVHQYLKELMVELKLTMETGVHHPITDARVKVWLHSVCCDLPAKAFIKQMPGHTGFDSCDRCYVQGESINNRTAFVQDNLPLRDNEWYTLDREESSPFQALQVDMSTLFTWDYMHGACLGIMKTLTKIWYEGDQAKPKPLRVQLDKRILELRKGTPCDFNRHLCEPFSVGDQKATQYRLFLLYVGPVLLKTFLTDDEYRNFLKLNVAMTVMCHPVKHRNLLDYVNELLRSFVHQFSILYGADRVTANFHNLYHAVDDCKRYGNLDLFSCFPYETNMNKIKSAVNSPSFPASQLYRRFHEKMTLAYELGEAAVLDDTNSEPMHPPTKCDYFWRGDCCISDEAPNNAVLISNRPALIRSFTTTEIMISGFADIEPFYLRPMSSKDLGIVVARKQSQAFSNFRISDITCKCFAVKYEDGYVFIPIIHTVSK